MLLRQIFEAGHWPCIDTGWQSQHRAFMGHVGKTKSAIAVTIEQMPPGDKSLPLRIVCLCHEPAFSNGSALSISPALRNPR